MKTIHFKEIDSTNTYLKENYPVLDNLTFVSADYQTKGRGRTGRIWDAMANNNLLFSVLIKDEELINKFKSISVISAYSIIEVLKELGINNATIKWPNDVYINDEKVCGILLEGVTTDKFECVIIGIGLNVNQKEFVGEYLHQPTSISLELNKEIDINELKEKVFNKIENNLLMLKDNHDFYLDVIKYDYLKDKEVYALINDEKKLVKVLGMNKDYQLEVLVDGKVQSLESGEVSFHI